MFKIGDFSKFCRVPVSALRYYADLGLLEPAHIDSFTGYRYYTFDQLPRLNRILALKDLGLELEQIGQVLNEDLSAEEIRGMLRLKHAEIQQRVEDEQARLRRVEARLKQIEQEGKMPDQEIILKKIESQYVLSIREIVPTPNDVGMLLGESFGALMPAGIQPISAPFTIFHDDEFKPSAMDVEIAIPVINSIRNRLLMQGGQELTPQMLPVIENAACVIHKGAHDYWNAAYGTLGKWVEANGYRLAGQIREVYLAAAESDSGPITEIQYPVEKA